MLSGHALDAARLRDLVERLPAHVVLVLDEAYAEFASDDASAFNAQLPLIHPRVVVTRTFSKAYGLAGLRIGYAIADAGLIDWLNRVRPPFPVNRVGAAGAAAALDDRAHMECIVAQVREGRRTLVDALGAMKIPVTDGSANFVLADFGPAAPAVYEGLLARGLITRAMHAYRLPGHLRISVGTADEIGRLVAAIGELKQPESLTHTTEEEA